MNVSTSDTSIARLALLSVSGLILIQNASYAQGMPGMAAKPSTVLVQKAQTIDNAINKKYIGKVEATEKVAVQPRVSGNIMSIAFREGDIVNKGDLLFVIEDTRYKAAVDDAHAKMGMLEAKLQYAKSNYDRSAKLLTTNAISKDSVENAKSTLHSLEAEIMAAESAITVAEDELKYTHLTAPVTGKAGRVSFSAGNYITPTSGSLVTITGMDPIYVRFPISERDFLSLFGSQNEMKKEAVVSLTLANGQPYSHPGKVFMTDNSVKPTTDTLNVWVEFPNKEEQLTDGGIVSVHLSKKNTDRFPAANISSVMHDSYKSYVYVVNDQGVVEKREVTLGNMVDNLQCFKSGVKDGEVVVIDGMHKIRPGAKVNAVYASEK